MVLSVFLDPLDPGNSTEELLEQLQDGDFGPFYGGTPGPVSTAKFMVP